MYLLVAKFAITTLVIVAVSEIAKRFDRMGALIAALPLITIMVMIWLHVEQQPSEKIANHAYFTFWLVLPSLPMFLLMSRMLRQGTNFWLALLAGIALTALCYLLLGWGMKACGMPILPQAAAAVRGPSVVE
ncbi:MAG TPA: hypothetical protein DCR55_13375 [Lentisphaeria bacterium]|nr:hypothetical protein [Lentisphaeria bacterium]